MGLAVGQLGAVNLQDSKESVVTRLIVMMHEAKRRGADFIVFPELALTTFFPRYWMNNETAFQTYFESSMPNDVTKPLFDTAVMLGIGFYIGYAELTEDNIGFNTSILVDKSGKIIGKYRKIHLPGHDDHKENVPFQHLEKKYFSVGDLGFRVFDLLNAKFGMCICNDRRWPETYRVMALQSAEIVVLGYNTPSVNIHWNEPVHLRTTTHLISLQANAYQNGLWVAAAGKCGSEDGYHMIGSSAIVAPTGEIVARTLTEEDEVICVQADLGLGELFRQHVFNFAKHRRPEHYQLIVDRTGAGNPVN
ncbi:N-carbamoyl-D-amino-acid hydrolase [Brenneria rubrifaciens]|uniref:N-carbamoyl-D-amino-acid hydrolase n=2 Tax=Brenneria rubrifaciens TaxID=55213 RepID=A0A4P8QT54_9GAMM|nr:N-carbamoyl-D-amino-acid hydrolase [Brenneria rubrifaciens]